MTVEKVAYARRFAESLRVTTGGRNSYCCPLCLERFPARAAESLTWDHYPPVSIGGRGRHRVLVCQTCQKRWMDFDVELDRVKRRQEFTQQHPGLHPVVFRVDDDRVRGLRHREALGDRDGGFVLFGRPEANVPEATARLTEFLGHLSEEGGWAGLKVEVQSDRDLEFSGRRVQRSFLKAAYLAAFDCLGYPYILSEALRTVRRQVLLAYVYYPRPVTSLVVLFLGYKIASMTLTFLPMPACPELLRVDDLMGTLRQAGSVAFVVFDCSGGLIADREAVVIDEQGNEWPLYQTGQ